MTLFFFFFLVLRYQLQTNVHYCLHVNLQYGFFVPLLCCDKNSHAKVRKRREREHLNGNGKPAVKRATEQSV